VKYLIPIILLALTATSCKQKETQKSEAPIAVIENAPERIYPKDITAVFDAHGGINTWNNMRNLCFTLEKEQGNETHTTDLKSRKSRIETDKFTLGFDGEKVWLAQDSTYYQPSRARFYHNLMFYFYAMPFVLGDDGITYTKEKPLVFNGTSYPGTRISFGAGVGDAPDDEYILYRDADTNQMAWLAYTVTYGKNEKSDRFSFIKYDQWEDVNGVLLPKTLQWYKVVDGIPTEMRNEMTFTKPTATETQLDEMLFSKPENGTFVE
jgi:hypothetical protein